MLHDFITATTCPSLLEELQAARRAYWSMTPEERVGISRTDSFVSTLDGWQAEHARWLLAQEVLPTNQQQEFYLIRTNQARHIARASRLLDRLRRSI